MCNGRHFKTISLEVVLGNGIVTQYTPQNDRFPRGVDRSWAVTTIVGFENSMDLNRIDLNSVSGASGVAGINVDITFGSEEAIPEVGIQSQ